MFLSCSGVSKTLSCVIDVANDSRPSWAKHWTPSAACSGHCAPSTARNRGGAGVQIRSHDQRVSQHKAKMELFRGIPQAEEKKLASKLPVADSLRAGTSWFNTFQKQGNLADFLPAKVSTPNHHTAIQRLKRVGGRSRCPCRSQERHLLYKEEATTRTVPPAGCRAGAGTGTHCAASAAAHRPFLKVG